MRRVIGLKISLNFLRLSFLQKICQRGEGLFSNEMTKFCGLAKKQLWLHGSRSLSKVFESRTPAKSFAGGAEKCLWSVVKKLFFICFFCVLACTIFCPSRCYLKANVIKLKLSLLS